MHIHLFLISFESEFFLADGCVKAPYVLSEDFLIDFFGVGGFGIMVNFFSFSI